jgi:hypothetical protein
VAQNSIDTGLVATSLALEIVQYKVIEANRYRFFRFMLLNDSVVPKVVGNVVRV